MPATIQSYKRKMYIFVLMKAGLKNLSIYLMTAILFFASTGFTLFSHFCLMEEKQTVSAQKMEDCCAKEPLTSTSSQALNSSNCCIDNSTYIKFDFIGATARMLEFSDVPLFITIFSAEPENIAITYSGYIFKDLPPPLSGRNILLNKQVFLI